MGVDSKGKILLLAVVAGVTMMACRPMARPSPPPPGAPPGAGPPGPGDRRRLLWGGGGKRADADSANAAGPGDREALDDQRG